MHIFAFALVPNGKTQIICFLIIMRELRPIDYYVCKIRNHKIRDVVFMEICTSIRNDLEMRPNGRNESAMVIVVDKSFKSSLCDDDEERDKQVKDHLVANKEAIEIFAEKIW